MAASDPEELKKHWELFEQAACKEKTWMHERLQWMIVPQGILFAALAWIFQLKQGFLESSDYTYAVDHIMWIVFSLGLILSIAGCIGAVAAGRMHHKWTKELNRIAKQLNKKEDEMVVSFGSKPYWPAISSCIVPTLIALAFCFGWIYIICIGYIILNPTILEYILSVTPITVWLLLFGAAMLWLHPKKKKLGLGQQNSKNRSKKSYKSKKNEEGGGEK